METLRHRRIRPGREYDKLFPVSVKQDTVVKGKGKAKLHHTINLIKSLVEETKNDTRVIAPILKGKDLEETCRNIWNFVYQHIQYKKDEAGIEQVRRPSRTWADRYQGVDCDCYTVFISSILRILNIPHKVRITKYGGKSHFQHIYPIVPKDGNNHQELSNSTSGYITIDCVADYPNYEVPFSECRDFTMGDNLLSGEINGIRFGEVSGVDSADLLSDDLGVLTLKPEAVIKQRLTLRQIVTKPRTNSGTQYEPKVSIYQYSNEARTAPEPPEKPAASKVSTISEARLASQNIAPLRLAPEEQYVQTVLPANAQWNKPLHIAGLALAIAGVGYGTYKIVKELTN
ncbi:hypothetical protein [Nafulsella turpanensis]|uniref:hypothetical protein n=1 Tax=Nafulsella turpanensis TaxID=1265690 RepID=UPI000345AB43|nr:hypothetical protein [Nafulsella turpanensis]